MQTSPRNTPQKGPKFLDTKVFIATLSIAVTVGMWNLFSNDALLAAKANANPDQSPSQPPADNGQDFPPLPTLVPLTHVSAVQTQGSAVSNTNTIPNNAQPVGLRSVAAPDQVIVQKVKPVFEQGGITSSSGGGGSSRPSAVTTTKSSRK
jgi:hypothetical protein